MLESMQIIQLHALPESDDEPWTIEVFCNQIDTMCRNAAVELHKKSLMVEEAVEEILSLVKRVSIDPEGEIQEDEFAFEGKKYI